MKNYKKSAIKVLLILLTLTVTFATKNVLAKETTIEYECPTSYVSKNYDIKMNDSTVTTDGKVTFTAKKAVSMDLYILKYGEIIDSMSNILVTSSGYDVTLKDGESLSAGFFIKGDKNCREDEYVQLYETENPEKNVKGVNSNYNGLCATYRTNASESAKRLDFYQKALPYCYSETVTANYSANDLQKIINNINSAWNSLQALYGTSSTPLVMPTDAVEISDPSKHTKLTCDAFSDQTNIKKFYHKEEYNPEAAEGVCSVECDEVFTVTYDAPQSAKGGVCFTYSVRVESKVTCNVIIHEEAPTFNPPELCDVIGYCNASGNYGTKYKDTLISNEVAAGPNEDFDLCVASCDGGKYTNKCIDKCYKEVYTPLSGIKKTLSYTDVIATKTSDCPDLRNDDPQALADAKIANPMGHYEKHGGSLSWVPDDDDCEFSQIALAHANNAARIRFTQNALNGRLRDGTKNHCVKDYWIEDGVLRSKGCYGVCDQDCGYKINGSDDCETDPESAVEKYEQELDDYNRKLDACKAKADCSVKVATYHMEVDVSIDGNKSTISFDSSNTPSESGNGQVIDKDGMIVDWGGECYGKNSSEYSYMTKINIPGSWVKKKGDMVVYTKPDDESAFLKKEDNKFCLPESIDNVNVKWWIWDQIGIKDTGVKRPELTDTAKSDILKDINYNIRSVIGNFGYFHWGVDVDCFYSTYNQPNPDDPGCVGGQDGKATSCTTCVSGNCTGKGGSDCVGSLCPDNNTTNPTNINQRTVDLNNLFPGSTYDTQDLANEIKNVTATKLSYVNKETVATKMANERVVGWNWSCGATNVNNPDYIIAPTTLIAHIQESGDSIYTNDSELDYEFYLDGKTIDKIRNYKNSKDYTKYCISKNNLGQCYSKKNEINTYTSDIVTSMTFTKVGSYSAAKRNTPIGCNNSYNGHCTTFADDTCTSSLKTAIGLNPNREV